MRASIYEKQIVKYVWISCTYVCIMHITKYLISSDIYLLYV